MNIFYLTELLSPYRIEWMNMLSADNRICAYYVLEEEKTRDQQWLDYKEKQFTVKKVPTSRFTGRLPSKAFLDEILSENFDIYLIDGYSSPIKLKTLRTLLKRGKKVYINIDGIDVWRPRSRSDIIKDRLKHRVFRSGAYFLCGSQLAADTVVAGGADREKVFVHPFTSLHREDIITAAQKAALQKKNKKQLGMECRKLALAVGRFIPLKQYDVLIRAWKDMPGDCFLTIIGGGQEKENYEKLIQALGVGNIALLDFMLPEKLNDYFCAADVFVHTSRTETWGLVFNEAMAKGCPVIATDRCVGAVELITDGEEGYLTAVGDVTTLHERMLRVLTDDGLRAAMSAKAIDRIAPYTYENLAGTHRRIFRETAER